MGDNDFVFEAGEVREAMNLFRIATRQAGGGGVGQGGRAASRDDGGFGTCDFWETLADRLHQLVDVNEVPRCLLHRLAAFRQHERSAEHPEHAFRIDHGPHTDRLVHVFAERQSECGCRRQTGTGYETGCGKCGASTKQRSTAYVVGSGVAQCS